MSLELERLGWKAFQDLCLTVTSEVLGQTVEGFLDSNDSGRDGAFYGTWADESLSGTFVIQAKHATRRDARLRLTAVRDELAKAEALVTRGLCDVYILMTNAGVTGRVAAELRETFLSVGVRDFRVFGSTWIERQILERPRLRALVPRLYGLGDLSQILDQRAYHQAAAVIDAMKESLSKFVLTKAYRDAIHALNSYGFVLLLGEPASGKTMIASALAVASADSHGARLLKADSTEFIDRHWNPHERQFFWADDSFGVNQYQPAYVEGWNRLLPKVDAAIGRGTRFVLTSRDYIYNAARNDLRETSFPLLQEAQVVIDVQDLGIDEKRQILYNHLKLGRQPQAFRRSIKPFLDAVATNQRFLPETARRLGDPLFTKDLRQTAKGLREFVEEPVAFLRDVLASLTPAQKASMYLIYLDGGAMASPVDFDDRRQAAIELFGVSPGECRMALSELGGSLVVLVTAGGRRQWAFKHPTVTDALTVMVAGDAEFMDVYLGGAPLGELLRAVVCGDIEIEGALSVPDERFAIVIERLSTVPVDWFDRQLFYGFLARRCSRDFLAAYGAAYPEVLERVTAPTGLLHARPEVLLTARLNELGLLPEALRKRFVATVSDLAVTIADPGFATHAGTRSVLRDDEFDRIRDTVREEVIKNLDDVLSTWFANFGDEDDPDEYFDPLFRQLDTYRDLYPDTDAQRAIENAANELDWWISDAKAERSRDYDMSDLPEEEVRVSSKPRRSIFDDVDE